jgi:hypothetical protein
MFNPAKRFSMLSLKNIHLISAIGGGHIDTKLTASAMNICLKHCDFGNATLLTHKERPSNLHADVEHIQIDPMDVRGYSKFILTELHKYMKQDRVMIVQHDGFIINPDAWIPEMASFDYIGAPWPVRRPQPCRVGNGGFSIRSRELQECTAELINSHYRPWLGNNEDEYICTSHREYLEEHGFTFASSGLSALFSVEFNSWHHEDNGGVPFGFHGFYEGREKYFQQLQKEL